MPTSTLGATYALMEQLLDSHCFPLRPLELITCIRAAFRRAGDFVPPARMLIEAGVTLDKGDRFVKVGNRYVDLTPSEFELLAVLMSVPDRVTSRSDLLEALRGVRCEGNKRLIDLHVKNLRAKIESDPRSHRYIETVYGIGYRFSGQLTGFSGESPGLRLVTPV